MLLDEGQRLQNLNNPNLAWSRDGRRLAYRADGIIYIRNLDEAMPREVLRAPGTGQWFSPDGHQLLYRTTSGLSKVPVEGGPSQRIVALEGLWGLDWAADGTIVYSDGKSIQRIADSGGPPTVLVTAPEGGQLFAPQVLPQGRALLFTLTEDTGSGIVTRTIDGGETDVRRLLPGVTTARYVPSGHILYSLEGRLMAVPFDADRLELTGPAVAMPESVYVSVAGLPQIAVSDTGGTRLCREGGSASAAALVGGPGGPVACGRDRASQLLGSDALARRAPGRTASLGPGQ
jgi:hypothetical protein